jgi:ribonuclease HII
MKKPTIKSLKEKADLMEAEEAFRWLSSMASEYGDSVQKLADKYYRKMEAIKEEKERLKAMSEIEREAYSRGFRFVGGIDEAGRGPLAGPVVAACVVLPPGIMIHKLNDSKKLAARAREQLFDIICEKAVSYGIGIIDNVTIDKMNIFQATKMAMELAIKNMNVKPDFLIIDDVRLPVEIPQRNIPKADQISVSVAAASILAKVTRDRIMDELDLTYPGYGFTKHKGYGTKEHTLAIREKGLCPIHRRSFTKKFF